MGHTYRWPFAYTNSITDESVTVAPFCSMNICGMVSFGGLLSEKLPCCVVYLCICTYLCIRIHISVCVNVHLCICICATTFV